MICPNCSNPKTILLFEAMDIHGSQKLSENKFPVLKCAKCQTIFPSLIKKKDYYKNYYPINYYQQRNSLFKFFQKIYQFFYSYWFNYSFSSYLKKGKVLDFGCGQGQFLASLPEDIIKYGLEINPEAVKFIKKNLHQIKIVNQLSSLKSKSLKFHLITLWHVFEHLESPSETLRQLVSFLEKDGWLILSTPNSQSLGFRIGQAYWFHLDAPRHLVIFDSNNLIKLCRALGLKVIKVKSNWLDFPFDLFWSIYNRFKTKYSSLNFLMGLFILPMTLLIKFACSFWPGKSETICLICKKT